MMNEKKMSGKWIVGVTGASGMPYALRLLEILSEQIEEVHVVFSEAAFRLLHLEHGIKMKASRLSTEALFNKSTDIVFFYDNKDIGAAIASGSFITDGMVVVPLSMGSLGAISSGICANLIHRAADVVLKEGRKLVLVPRETPLSTIHLENLLKLSQMGTSVVPAMPGFYQQPANLDELVDMMVMKILDQMGLHVDLVPRWGSDSSTSEEDVKVVEQETLRSLHLKN